MGTAVVLVALFFLWMGASALVVPQRVLALFDVSVMSAAGRNEVRAVYGGFGVAGSFLLLVGTRVPSLRPGILVTLATAVAGMAVGRLVSVVVDRSPAFYPWLFFATEIVIAATLFAAARS